MMEKRINTNTCAYRRTYRQSYQGFLDHVGIRTSSSEVGCQYACRLHGWTDVGVQYTVQVAQAAGVCV